MGVRTVRFCDITGVESDDVVHHELQIDQMRIEIDLVDTEYERLLDALRPFIDAGRVEASIPTVPAAPTAVASAAGSELMPTGSAVAGVGDGGDRDLLADLTVLAAGRGRVGLTEAAASLQQLDPVAYAGWVERVLTRELPEAAKPYNDQSGRWISTKKILTARGIVRHRRKSANSRKSPNSASRSGAARSGLF